MTSPRTPPVLPLTQTLVDVGYFAQQPFVLVDVGASGGIEGHWRVFKSALRAYGFDPLVKEIERLNRAERSASVRYFEGFIGCDHSSGNGSWISPAYDRSSARRAQKLLGMSFAARFNSGDPEIAYTGERFSLDRFFARNPVDNVDFIKIDTDGDDFNVLCGAEHLIRSKGVLGLFVECQLHGAADAHANTFANIDRLLRDLGFTLYDMEVYRYTRAALPGPFMYRIPAQTFDGPVSFAEAFYARDLAAPGQANPWGQDADASKLGKLLCLFEIFGLPDCAAELLIAKGSEFTQVFDQGLALDMLATHADPQAPSYRTLNDRFDHDPRAFFPADADRTHGSSADPRTDQLKAELLAMRSSLSWKLTAPLRRLRRFLSD